MDKILSMIEYPRPKTVVEEEKMIHFISQTSIWDYFDISESTCKSYLVQEKFCLLNKYCSELYETCYGSGILFFLSLFRPYGLIFCWLEFFVCIWPCFVWCFLACGKEILNAFLCLSHASPTDHAVSQVISSL